MLRLASNANPGAGAIWSKEPNNYAEWEVELAFRVHGKGPTGGDGMAFWLTKEKGQEGPIFGSKNRWTGLGVFLDTHDDDGHKNNPAIVAVMNDGSVDYNMVDESANKILFECFKDFRNPVGRSYLKISYVGRKLKVLIDKTHYGKVFEVCGETEVDIPKGYYFGVSASSLINPDDHDLHAIDVYEVKPSLEGKEVSVF